uniref:Epidermal retinol dehydrogenase 2 n=1 Tax=Bubo bubo TaxID=30461 RepID=A0A8C0F354_BUBBB
MSSFTSILKILEFLKLLIFFFFENLILLIFPPCKKKKFYGRQIALKFAPLGAALVLWDIDGEGNKETSTLAQKNGATQVLVYHCDCSSREEVYEQADKVRKEVGDVTILISNAGILLGEKFCDVSDADFEKTLRVNFFSQVWTCKAFLPAMMTCNHGHLVSTASAAGLLEIRDYYSASKHGVKTTVICPYFINTKLAKGFQTKNPLILPVYDAEYAASKIMDAIQKEKFYLIMPLTSYIFSIKTKNVTHLLAFMDKAFSRKKKD